jgi:hypothetical protein
MFPAEAAGCPHRSRGWCPRSRGCRRRSRRSRGCCRRSRRSRGAAVARRSRGCCRRSCRAPEGEVSTPRNAVAPMCTVDDGVPASIWSAIEDALVMRMANAWVAVCAWPDCDGDRRRKSQKRRYSCR